MEINKYFQINKHCIIIIVILFLSFMGCTYRGSIKSDLNINNNHNHKRYPLSIALVENENNLMKTLPFSVGPYSLEIKIYPEIMKYIHLHLERFFKNVQIVKDGNLLDNNFDLLIYPTIRGGGAINGTGNTPAKIELTFLGRTSNTHEDIFKIKEIENLAVVHSDVLAYGLVTIFTLCVATPITVPLMRDNWGKSVTNELEDSIKRILEKSCNRIKNNYSLKRYIFPWKNQKNKEAVEKTTPSKNKQEVPINY